MTPDGSTAESGAVLIADVFRPVVGLPSWGATNFHGSMFLLELGQPHLHVSEQRRVPLRLANGPDAALRRQASVRGDWTLEILYCAWDLRLGTTVVAHDESPHLTIADALRLVDGQRLTSVGGSGTRTTFVFDLATTLTIAPSAEGYGADAELWTLLTTTGAAWSLLEDGTLSTERASPT